MHGAEGGAFLGTESEVGLMAAKGVSAAWARATGPRDLLRPRSGRNTQPRDLATHGHLAGTPRAEGQGAAAGRGYLVAPSG